MPAFEKTAPFTNGIMWIVPARVREATPTKIRKLEGFHLGDQLRPLIPPIKCKIDPPKDVAAVRRVELCGGD